MNLDSNFKRIPLCEEQFGVGGKISFRNSGLQGLLKAAELFLNIGILRYFSIRAQNQFLLPNRISLSTFDVSIP